MSDGNNSAEVTGKKIFFLYPTVSIQNQIISKLAQEEYEVYVAKDHTRLARALKDYPDSIIFINIDENMPEPEWEKWIISTSSQMPEISIGIFSSSNNEDIKNKYIDTLHVSCGFTGLRVDMSGFTEKILNIVEKMNAKGRRKFIRASIEKETNAVMNMPHNNDFLNGVIRDISIVGFSCVLESEPGLIKNSLVKDIQIKLQSMLLKVDAIVFGSRIEGEEKKYVLLFSKRLESEDCNKIRKYIQGNLQTKMDAEIN